MKTVYQAEIDRTLTKIRQDFEARKFTSCEKSIDSLLNASNELTVRGWELVLHYKIRCSKKRRTMDQTKCLARDMISRESSDLRGYYLLAQVLLDKNLFKKAKLVLQMGLKRAKQADPLVMLLQKEELSAQREMQLAPKRRDPVKCLPYEVLELVFRTTRFSDLAVWRSVSKSWKQVIDGSPRLWKSAFSSQYLKREKIVSSLDMYLSLSSQISGGLPFAAVVETSMYRTILKLLKTKGQRIDTSSVSLRVLEEDMVDKSLVFLQQAGIQAAKVTSLEVHGASFDKMALEYIFNEYPILETLHCFKLVSSVPRTATRYLPQQEPKDVFMLPATLKVLSLSGDDRCDAMFPQGLDLAHLGMISLQLTCPIEHLELSLPSTLRDLALNCCSLSLRKSSRPLTKLKRLLIGGGPEDVARRDTSPVAWNALVDHGSMTNVTTLTIRSTNAAGVKYLCCHLALLNELSLDCINFNDSDLLDVAKACPKLEVVRLEMCSASNEGLLALANLPKMKRLVYRNSAIPMEFVDICTRRKIKMI